MEDRAPVELGQGLGQRVVPGQFSVPVGAQYKEPAVGYLAGQELQQ